MARLMEESGVRDVLPLRSGYFALVFLEWFSLRKRDGLSWYAVNLSADKIYCSVINLEMRDLRKDVIAMFFWEGIV